MQTNFHQRYESLPRGSSRGRNMRTLLSSLQARLLNFLGYKLPFDRHDWYVDRCGRTVHYVIDFYAGQPVHPAQPAPVFIDVRPAVESIEAIVDRTLLQMRWVNSGRWRTEQHINRNPAAELTNQSQKTI